MTTIVNTPPAQNNTGGNLGMIIVILILIVMGYIFMTVGLPAIRQMQTGAPQINIPSKIDVNINQPAK